MGRRSKFNNGRKRWNASALKLQAANTSMLQNSPVCSACGEMVHSIGSKNYALSSSPSVEKTVRHYPHAHSTFRVYTLQRRNFGQSQARVDVRFAFSCYAERLAVSYY